MSIAGPRRSLIQLPDLAEELTARHSVHQECRSLDPGSFTVVPNMPEMATPLRYRMSRTTFRWHFESRIGHPRRRSPSARTSYPVPISALTRSYQEPFTSVIWALESENASESGTLLQAAILPAFDTGVWAFP